MIFVNTDLSLLRDSYGRNCVVTYWILLRKKMYNIFCLISVFIHFCRDWFVPTQSEVELLSLELSFERRLRAEAEVKLKEAVTARIKAEREMEIYKVLHHIQ